MDNFYILMGIVAIYSTIHFFVIQHNKNWKKRTQYEKVVSVTAIVCISLVYLGLMFGE